MMLYLIKQNEKIIGVVEQDNQTIAESIERGNVSPSLVHGFFMAISGRNRSDIKEYIGDCFHGALWQDQGV